MDPVSVLAVGAMLGEGPVWIGDAVWFVDIKGHKVHRFDPATKAHKMVGGARPGRLGAAGRRRRAGHRGQDRAAPARSRDAARSRCCTTPSRTGRATASTTPPPTCAAGCGSARWTTANRSQTGYLYRCVDGLCADSGLPPVAITNGPALNADGTVLYHTDTLGRVIYRVPVNDDGSLGAPVPFVTIEDGGGYPDGPVVDVEGCLWTGLYAGWSVRRYDPQGKLIKTVRLPTANVTKMCFGGPDLKTAYATTARKNLDAAALAAQPEAGNLFAFDPGVAGLPVTPAKITGLGK